MKAALFNGIEQISVEDVKKPAAPENGILIKVHGCSVCGSDIRTYFHGNSLIHPPWIIGHETVGEVVENNSNQEIPIGQRVAVCTAIPCGHCHHCYLGHFSMCSNMVAHGFDFPGGFAEYMAIEPLAIQQGAIHVVPDNVSSDEACLTEPLACVLNGQEILNVGLLDRVVVIGTGAIGCLHIQVARARGASQVIAFDLDDNRLEIARQFDVDCAVNSNKEDPIKVVEKLTHGLGASVVIVACGVAKAQALALELAGPRGRICNFGGLPKSNPMSTINANLIHYKELSIYGSFSSSPRQNGEALDLISSGKVNVKPVISKCLPLEKLESAILDMKRGAAMKIVIHPNE